MVGMYTEDQHLDMFIVASKNLHCALTVGTGMHVTKSILASSWVHVCQGYVFKFGIAIGYFASNLSLIFFPKVAMDNQVATDPIIISTAAGN